MGGDEPAGLHDPVQVHSSIDPQSSQHVEDVLSADIPTGPPGVGTAAQPGGAAVNHSHSVLQASQNVGQRLDKKILSGLFLD